MKKIVPVLLCALLSLALFAGCASNDLTISIGNGMIENDGVSVRLQYGDTWNDNEKIFTVHYGHESEAVLADNYYISFCDADPTFESSVTLHTIFSFTKADLEGRTVSGTRFSGDAAEIVAGTLSDVLPQGEGTCTAYIVLSSSVTDFSDITTYSAHEFTYEWQENGLKLIDG